MKKVKACLMAMPRRTSHRTMSHPTMSHPTVSHPTVSHRTVPHRTVSHRTAPRYPPESYATPTSRATPSSRASVPKSAWPFTVSGRQCRWNARSTVANAGSSGPSGATR